MVDYIVIIFPTVCYNKYEYLQHDIFSLEQQVDLFVFFLKKDLSVIQKYSTAVMPTWGRLPLLPIFGTIFQKHAKIWQFLCLSGNF